MVDLATLGELMTPLERADISDTILELLEASGFPTTSWHTYSVPRRLIDAFSQVLADVSLWISWAARGGVLELAEDNGWLDLAASWYEVERYQAERTVGTITLTDAGGGPHVIAVGSVVVQSDSGLYYRNTTGGTLLLNDELDLEFRAEAAGEASNVPGGTISTLITSLSTVTVANAADWITTPGRDLERAEDLITRCKAKWGTLGTGSPALALESWAMEAAPAVTKVTVRDDNPIGNATAQVVLATGAGPASAVDVITVQAIIDTKRAVGSVVEAIAATSHPITVTATITVRAASRLVAEAEVIAAFAAFVRDNPIGETVYRAQLVELLMSGTGVKNVDLSTLTPAADVTLGPLEVATITLSLTWIEVAS